VPRHRHAGIVQSCIRHGSGCNAGCSKQKRAAM